MPSPQVSAQEQLMIELLNRARLDPLGEAARFGVALNSGLPAGSITSAPKAPLAFDWNLAEAAAGHSSWMLGADVFSHTGCHGCAPDARMKEAGYGFTGSWSWGENIVWKGTTGTLDLTAAIQAQHRSLFLSALHRENIFGDFREVGVAQEVGRFTEGLTTFNASMVTQNFAKTGSEAFITGVAFDDRDGDRFYDVGEGRSGIVIDWLGSGGGAVGTASAGGYGVRIPTGLQGMAHLSVKVGAVTMQASLGMTGTNVKLDVIDGRVLAASADLALGARAADGRLLGVADLDLSGNDARNRLEGNAGANRIEGGGGADLLSAGGGADALVGGAGKDRLSGGAGADDFVFLAEADSRPGATTRDIIADFVRGQDDIDLSRIDADAGEPGHQRFTLDRGGAFEAGEIRQTGSGRDLVLSFNTNNDGAAEMAILLLGVANPLAATDFLL
jgi:Ca2+-binding RTX toxin-like protein